MSSANTDSIYTDRDVYDNINGLYTEASNKLLWAKYEKDTAKLEFDKAYNEYKDAESLEIYLKGKLESNQAAYNLAEKEYNDYAENYYGNGSGSIEELNRLKDNLFNKLAVVREFNSDYKDAKQKTQDAMRFMSQTQASYNTKNDNVKSIETTVNRYAKELALLTKDESNKSSAINSIYVDYEKNLNDKAQINTMLYEKKRDLDIAKGAYLAAQAIENDLQNKYDNSESLSAQAEKEYEDYKKNFYDNGIGTQEELNSLETYFYDKRSTAEIAYINLNHAITQTQGFKTELENAESNYKETKKEFDNIALKLKSDIKKIAESRGASEYKTVSANQNKVKNNMASEAYDEKIKKIPSINETEATYQSSNSTYQALQDVYASNLIFSIANQNWYNKINRYGWIDPYDQDKVLREFLFFTKPDLSLFGTYYKLDKTDKTSNIDVHGGRYGIATLRSDMNNATIIETSKRMPYVLTQLQSSLTDPDGKVNPFMYLLTNAVTSKLDLPTISTDSQESTSNIMGTSMHYRGHSYKSDNGYDFSLSFTDTAYLEIYHMVKCYDEYVRMVKTGLIRPFKDHIRNRIVPEQFSIYKFLVGSDGETILYYAKLTGCYFTDVPRSDMADPGDEVKFSLSFHAQFVEDMNPEILKEFSILTNYASSRSSIEKKFLDVYNGNAGIVNNRWATYPTIIKAASNDGSQYSKRISRRSVNYDYFLKWI